MLTSGNFYQKLDRFSHLVVSPGCIAYPEGCAFDPASGSFTANMSRAAFSDIVTIVTDSAIPRSIFDNCLGVMVGLLDAGSDRGSGEGWKGYRHKLAVGFS